LGAKIRSGSFYRPIPLAFQTVAHELFAKPIVILPGVVEKGDAGVEGAVDNLSGFRLLIYRAEIIATDSRNRNLESCLS
jgi:hypothetical protein